MTYFPSYTNIPEEYSHLFTNYNEDTFENTLMRLSKDITNYPNIELAGRLLIHKNVLLSGSLENYLSVYRNRLSDRVYNFMVSNLEFLSNFLEKNDYMNYLNKNYFSALTYINQYLLKPNYKKFPLETPMMMFLRVACHTHLPDLQTVLETTLDMGNGLYTPASPTLFNCGTRNSQGSSCFLGTIGDNLPSILGTGINDMGDISKSKGGIGLGITLIRDSSIKGAGRSKGIKPVMKLYNDLIEYVDQSGSRKGAATVHLHDWHINIEDFINSRSTQQDQKDRLEQLNTCIWVSNLFIERCKRNEGWMVFCPSRVDLYGKYSSEFEREYLETERRAIEDERVLSDYKKVYEDLLKLTLQHPHESEYTKHLDEINNKITEHENSMIIFKRYNNANEVLDKICSVELQSGMPYIMYGDSINTKSNQSNIGMVNSSNLCVEITEVSDVERIASCNLSSISLKEFVIKPFDHSLLFEDNIKEYYNFDKLGEITRKIVRNLNSIITNNTYPVADKTSQLNFDTRPLGIGVSGLDDAIKRLDLIFESNEAEILNKYIFACMYYNALDESCEIAKENGWYKYFDKGTFKIESIRELKGYLERSEKDSNGVYTYTFEGCPFKNGFLQFDLWSINAEVLKVRGQLIEMIDGKPAYNTNDDIPVSMFNWKLLREKIMKYGVYNSLLLTCMPTASTAQVLDNAESTEVHTSNLYCRKTGNEKNCIVFNKNLFRDFEEIGLYTYNFVAYLRYTMGSIQNIDKFYESDYEDFSDQERENYRNNKLRVKHLIEKYKTMYEISQKTVLKYSRQRAIYIDQSQSLNIYMKDATLNKVKGVHYFGNALGLKTGMYYLRQPGKYQDTPGFTVLPKLIKFFASMKIGNSDEYEKTVSPIDTNTLQQPLRCSIISNDEEDNDNECLMCGA